ncbi:tRNA(adenine34) deaminase [Didymella heteroderae]|uniref:tRNA(adenine(34)) deaminase n=1 Tax=Didymella heteroderae TaxID=1769908 RepID=A0A9P5BWH4_9PLEO|nr:tRNA(adenine34) deaminase [Didymella heteroderae]
MFTRARQEPWVAAVVASGALGLALYYLSARRPSPANIAKRQPESEEPSETSTTDFVAEDMSAEDRAYHERFMREAIGMAELALTSDETPVGCVFVKDGEIIGRGMNETNRTLNGTRHAEFVAIAGILSKNPISILSETDLYVTVEPCVMCASMLRQYGIRAVYFGCWNERFGGTGGVLNMHSDPSVDKPYPVTGGIFREEAIMLLRKFYVQENEKAPEPKQKKTRELKTEILPMDIHAPKSTPSPALVTPVLSSKPANPSHLVAVPHIPGLTATAATVPSTGLAAAAAP